MHRPEPNAAHDHDARSAEERAALDAAKGAGIRAVERHGPALARLSNEPLSTAVDRPCGGSGDQNVTNAEVGACWLVYSGEDRRTRLPVEPVAITASKTAENYRESGYRVEGPYVRDVALVDATDAQADRNRWIRAFNRLEKAVTNHVRDCIDADGLAHAHKAVMREVGPNA